MRDLTGKAVSELTAEDILYLAQRNRLTPEIKAKLDEDNLAEAMRGEAPLVWKKPKKKKDKKPKLINAKGEPLEVRVDEQGSLLSPISGDPMVPKHVPEHGVVHITREGSIMDRMPEDLYDPAWTNDHLRHECHIRGLSMDGRKDMLITRLVQFDELLLAAEGLDRG